MNVALCISGQPRNALKGYEFIKEHVIEPNNPDVFLHMWYDPKQTGEQFHNAGGFVVSDPIPEDYDLQIVDLYKPVAWQSIPQIQYEVPEEYNDRKFVGITPFYTISQKEAIAMADLLRQTKSSVKYDAVIRMRYDWAITDYIEIEDYDLDYIHMPNDCNHKGGINDQFAIANSENMKLYANLNQRIREYFFDDEVVFCDEVLLGHHLRKNDAEFHLHRFNYSLLQGGYRLGVKL